MVTIGPALTALYSLTLRMVRNEDSYVLKSYFVAFKENFKISFVSWLILLGVLVVSIVDYRISLLLITGAGTFLSIISLILIFLCFVVALYLFPYIARFENTLKYSFKSAIFMAIASIPYTLLLIAITGFFVVFFVFLLPIQYTILAGLLFGFAFLAYVQALIFKKVFVKYEPERGEKVEE